MTLQDHIEEKLDHALEMTFPASDPFTIHQPEVEPDDEARPVPTRDPRRTRSRESMGRAYAGRAPGCAGLRAERASSNVATGVAAATTALMRV